MAIIWSRLLPKAPDGPRGLDGPYWMLVVVAGISTARGLIHVFAPDGGAQSIAGIRVDVAGGINIVAIFAQWGASQLVLALIIWVVLVKYRPLVPMMWLVTVSEQLLRLLTGHLKPLSTEQPPPGAYWTYILLPLAIFMLLASLWDGRSKSKN